MLWSEFYDKYIDWSESTINSKISSLEDIGPGDEVLEVLYELSSEKVKDKLVRKAMRLRSSFSHDIFMEIEGEISEAVFKELANYAGFDADNPYLDESNLTWNDFYEGYCGWDDQDVLRRINKIKGFGKTEEICGAICDMPDTKCEQALYQKAISSGVKFSREQLKNMGMLSEDDFITGEEVAQIEAQTDELCKALGMIEEPEEEYTPQKRLGFFGGLLAIAGAFSKSRNNRRNNGSCNDEPPHYGYRYGRWYYGRGHRHNCQKGGNGRHPQRTSRD